MEANPCGLDGIDFLEYCGEPEALAKIFEAKGFKKIGKHKSKDVHLYRQGDINFLINNEPESFAHDFKTQHGPSICATGWRCENAQKAFETAVERGAKPFEGRRKEQYPAIHGIGDSLIYFIDKYGDQSVFDDDFEFTDNTTVKGYGYTIIDHLTNNVPQGEMQKWCDFYENIFNFKEKRFFDIKGSQTGLVSKVMRSPDGGITIPINEPSDPKSQIQEYLDEYKGSGIQHIALLTDDICNTVASVRENKVDFLETPDTYFDMIPERLSNVTEEIDVLKKLKILVDGDDEGYLLQIFTQNLVGPIFFETIQRKNHWGFGEGNFQALFDAIERDQIRRGVL